MGGKILEIHNLTKSFGNKKILDKFSYSFNKGEKVGIIGKNGVGKTTFLNLIMDIEQPDSGKIIKGESVSFQGRHVQFGDE
jgi:ATP-binding cassette subfamily F protein uup